MPRYPEEKQTRTRSVVSAAAQTLTAAEQLKKKCQYLSLIIHEF